MAMELARYMLVNAIEPTPPNARRVERVREAAVYLRARAYRRYLRTPRDEASSNLFGLAERASRAFERRHLADLLRVGA